MTNKDNPELQDAARNPVGQSEPSSDKPAQSSPSPDDEITKKIRVLPATPESDWEPLETSGNLDSRPITENGRASEWVPETESKSQHGEEVQPDQLEGSNGWWGDVPFTPIDDSHEEDTQPVVPPVDDPGATRVMFSKEDDSNAVTRILQTPGKDETGSGTETRVTPVKEEQPRVTDDIPTLPPPNAPPGWRPENPNLPKVVSEVDDQATRVTPSAYTPAKRPDNKNTTARPNQKKGRRPSEMARPEKPAGKAKAPVVSGGVSSFSDFCWFSSS